MVDGEIWFNQKTGLLVPATRKYLSAGHTSIPRHDDILDSNLERFNTTPIILRNLSESLKLQGGYEVQE